MGVYKMYLFVWLERLLEKLILVQTVQLDEALLLFGQEYQNCKNFCITNFCREFLNSVRVVVDQHKV